MLFEDRFDTYINQPFGNITIREIYTEVNPNSKYELEVEPFWWIQNGKVYQNGEHHYIRNKVTGEKICSIKSRLQNIRIDKNDNLCQSYSLARYCNISITKDKIKKHMEIINMYRNILKDNKFMDKINEEILENPDNKRLWKIYKNNQPTKHFINMNKDIFVKSISTVLDDWEKFGYNYFIGDGYYSDIKKSK
jgi:hypothetical protein